jgi:hypothetical protein
MENEQYGSMQEEEEEADLTLDFGHSGFVSRYVPPHSGEDEDEDGEVQQDEEEEDGEIQQDEEDQEEANDLGAAELGEGEEEAGAESQLKQVLSGPEAVVTGRRPAEVMKKKSKVRRQSKDKGEKVSTRLWMTDQSK